MAYQMQYDYQTVVIEKVTRTSRVQYLLLTVALVLCVIGVRFGGSLLEMLLLGEANTVKTALTQMADDLQDGVKVEQAVAVFYDNIVE